MEYVIQKSLSGIYEYNDFNRRLGRVGQKYNHSSGHIIIDSILISLNNEAVKKAYKEKIAKLTKADRIIKEIDRLESVIDRENAKIEESKTITEEQILRRSKGTCS